MRSKTKVWDVPTRLCHWVLLVLFLMVSLTGLNQEDSDGPHFIIGEILLVLIVWRIAWGFWGSFHSRFINFVKSPRDTLSYTSLVLKRQAPSSSGHNPLGGWMVIALLVSLVVQGLTGLLSSDGLFKIGPLANQIDDKYSAVVSIIHIANFNVLLFLIFSHIFAVLLHLLVRENLIWPMITGVKSVGNGEVLIGSEEFKSKRIALVLFVCAAICLRLVLSYLS